MFAFPVLIGDIGGTNARFAVLPAPGEADPASCPRILTAAAPDPVDRHPRHARARMKAPRPDRP